MTNLDTINMLVQEGEGLTVEFKERFTPRIDEDIVAFANTKGGAIFLGVKDDRTVSGEKLTNDLKARINSIARNCSPPIQVKLNNWAISFPLKSPKEKKNRTVVSPDISGDLMEPLKK